MTQLTHLPIRPCYIGKETSVIIIAMTSHHPIHLHSVKSRMIQSSKTTVLACAHFADCKKAPNSIQKYLKFTKSTEEYQEAPQSMREGWGQISQREQQSWQQPSLCCCQPLCTASCTLHCVLKYCTYCWYDATPLIHSLVKCNYCTALYIHVYFMWAPLKYEKHTHHASFCTSHTSQSHTSLVDKTLDNASSSSTLVGWRTSREEVGGKYKWEYKFALLWSIVRRRRLAPSYPSIRLISDCLRITPCEWLPHWGWGVF